jgi:hypothetical protein
MSEFNNMTIVAAAEIISEFNSHSDMEVLEVQWGITEKCNSSSKSARVASWAKIATTESIEVMIETGRVTLGRALVETALKAPENQQDTAAWKKFIAGLRFDGFEITEKETDHESDWGIETRKTVKLVRMIPSDIPDLDFREAESEIEALLGKNGFQTAKGHLTQAISNFSQGNWSSANAMIRDFYQELLDKIAEKLGCDPSKSDDAKRQYLAGEGSGPFLFHEYNEWENDRGKPSFVLGLWARLHPHGSHPGLSDEEDCAFRFQIILITTRLFLRRFDKRMSTP